MTKNKRQSWWLESEHKGSVFGDVQAYALANGLKVIVVQDPSSPVSEVQTWFAAGSARDPVGKGGLAHLLEHLMFRGTVAVPDAGFDEIMEEHGVYVNAATWLDWTSYRASLPADALDLVLGLEADRMTGLHLDAEVFRSEREVVRNERRQFVDNDPDGLASELLLETLFGTHTYSRPVLGTEDNIDALTTADCRLFYRQVYAPALTTLVIVGPDPAEYVLPLVFATHGRIRKKAAPTPVIVPPAPLAASISLERRWPVNQPRLSLAYLAPDARSPQQVPLKVLAEILAGAESCPFNNRVVEELALSLSVEALCAGMGVGGIFEVHLEPREATADVMQRLLAEFDAEVARLATTGPTQADLDAARNRMRISVLRGSIGVEGRCSLLGEYQATTGDYRNVFGYCDALDAMTTAEVAAAAAQYLYNMPRVVLRIYPDAEGEE